METLDNTDWDVLIVGTGLRQSLLALALSRSGKKILHTDDNDYYGGAEAAFSLQETEEWAEQVNKGSAPAAFSDITITQEESSKEDSSTPSLSFSRAYSLDVSPQIIYARSSLLQYLVSSKVYRQLEFLPVGSFWVYSTDSDEIGPSVEDKTSRHGQLLKVPNGREDVFQDQVLDFKAKRALMKFLRFIAEYEEQTDVWQEHRKQPFREFLSEKFKVLPLLQAPLLALTLSPAPSNQTTTEYALPRVARHLRSIGTFGAGFGAVIPKWGGMSEINQVGCRACAVGGGVYVLGKGLSSSDNADLEHTEAGLQLHLRDNETVKSKWIVGESLRGPVQDSFSRLISIVDSTLAPLFPPIAEEAPPPASAVVVFPSETLSLDSASGPEQLPPVQIFVHSSDTGECPVGQSVVYATTSLGGERGYELLKKVVDTLLSTVDVTPTPTTLWSVRYQQRCDSPTALPSDADEHILQFPSSSLDLAFNDDALDQVKDFWQKIMGDEAGEFLVFEDREAYDDD